MKTAMALEIFKIQITISTFLLFFLVFYLLQDKKVRCTANTILAGFFLSIGFSSLAYILYLYRIEDKIPYFQFMGFAFHFLYGPSLFLYTALITRFKPGLQKKDLLHTIPFFVSFTVLLIAFHGPNGTRNAAMVRQDQFKLQRMIHFFFLTVQYFTYAFLSIKVINQYRNKLSEFYSSIEKIDLSWLKFLILGFSFFLSFDLFNHWYKIIMDVSIYILMGPWYNVIYLSESSYYLFFASYVVFRALHQPDLFKQNLFRRYSQKYRTSPLQTDDKSRFLKRVEQCMVEEKLYLKSELTLNDLSDASKVPMRYISQILNEVLNRHFNDYVNQYRIEFAKQQLISTDFKDKTILEILYDAGFNSKSVFNKAFKNHVGVTPRQFRNMQS